MQAEVEIHRSMMSLVKQLPESAASESLRSIVVM